MPNNKQVSIAAYMAAVRFSQAFDSVKILKDQLSQLKLACETAKNTEQAINAQGGFGGEIRLGGKQANQLRDDAATLKQTTNRDYESRCKDFGDFLTRASNKIGQAIPLQFLYELLNDKNANGADKSLDERLADFEKIREHLARIDKLLADLASQELLDRMQAAAEHNGEIDREFPPGQINAVKMFVNSLKPRDASLANYQNALGNAFDYNKKAYAAVLNDEINLQSLLLEKAAEPGAAFVIKKQASDDAPVSYIVRNAGGYKKLKGHIESLKETQDDQNKGKIQIRPDEFIAVMLNDKTGEIIVESATTEDVFKLQAARDAWHAVKIDTLQPVENGSDDQKLLHQLKEGLTETEKNGKNEDEQLKIAKEKFAQQWQEKWADTKINEQNSPMNGVTPRQWLTNERARDITTVLVGEKSKKEEILTTPREKLNRPDVPASDDGSGAGAHDEADEVKDESNKKNPLTAQQQNVVNNSYNGENIYSNDAQLTSDAKHLLMLKAKPMPNVLPDQQPVVRAAARGSKPS